MRDDPGGKQDETGKEFWDQMNHRFLLFPRLNQSPAFLGTGEMPPLNVSRKPSAAQFKKAMADVCSHWASGFTSAHQPRAHFPWEVPALPEHGRALGWVLLFQVDSSDNPSLAQNSLMSC